jgi:hypothetical protein
MSEIKYEAAVSRISAAVREPGHETNAEADEHAVRAGESMTLCGQPVAARTGAEFVPSPVRSCALCAEAAGGLARLRCHDGLGGRHRSAAERPRSVSRGRGCWVTAEVGRP